MYITDIPEERVHRLMEQEVGPLNDEDVDMEPAPLLIPEDDDEEEVRHEPEIGILQQQLFLTTSL